jgi:hypothetical protein
MDERANQHEREVWLASLILIFGTGRRKRGFVVLVVFEVRF